MSDTNRKLAMQLVGERFFPALAHLTLFGLLLSLVWHQVPPWFPIAWGGAISSVTLLRLLLWERARHGGWPPGAVVQMVRGIMLLLGLAWGMGAAYALGRLSPADGALILLGLTGLLAGALATLVADQLVYPIYAAAMFLPCIVVVGFVEPGLFDELGIVLIIIYLVFTMRLHKRAHADLLRRLHIEEQLRHEQRQLADAQRIAHVGSWEWDIASNVVTWSDELRRMYGLGPDVPAGYQEFLARAHPEDRARLEAVIAQALTTRESVDYEWRCIRPSGEIRHILGRNIVVTDATGEAVRMAGTSLDITARKQAEENQRTLLRDLQASVAEVRVLRGILPICSSCKRIRGESGGWQAVERYVRDHTNAEFSHGLCPDCAARDWGASPVR